MHELFFRSDGLLSRAMLPLHFMCLHGTDQMSRRETQRSNKNEASKRQEAVSHHVPSSFLKLSSCARLADGRNIEWFKPGAAQSNRLANVSLLRFPPNGRDLRVQRGKSSIHLDPIHVLPPLFQPRSAIEAQYAPARRQSRDLW